MITQFSIIFTIPEIVNFFRKNGFEVEQRPVITYDRNDIELRHTDWQVLNPSTREWLDMDFIFHKIMSTRQNKLFLEGYNKLDIINCFDE